MRFFESERVRATSLITGAILIASVILAFTMLRLKTVENQTISVTGAYSQPVTSDRALWRTRVEATAPNQQAAYKALAADINKVTAWLGKQGVKPDAMDRGYVEVNPIYKQGYNGANLAEIEAYRLAQEITVSLADVQKISSLSQGVAALLNDGVNVQGFAPQYLYTKLDDLKVEALGKAIENAKLRGQSMANATGAHVGSLRSADMGVFQITPADSTDVADYGMNDTTTIQKKVTAVVNVTFQLD